MKTKEFSPKVLNTLRVYRKEIARRGELIKLLLRKESLIMAETFDNESKESLAIKIQGIILSQSSNGDHPRSTQLRP